MLKLTVFCAIALSLFGCLDNSPTGNPDPVKECGYWLSRKNLKERPIYVGGTFRLQHQAQHPIDSLATVDYYKSEDGLRWFATWRGKHPEWDRHLDTVISVSYFYQPSLDRVCAKAGDSYCHLEYQSNGSPVVWASAYLACSDTSRIW
jgi:hypothetical protein